MTFELFSKSGHAYFSGTIKKGYFPVDGKKQYYIACNSCAGGNAPPLLELIEWKENLKKDIVLKIESFRKKYRLIFNKINEGGLYHESTRQKHLLQG